MLTGLLALSGCSMFSSDDDRYKPAELTQYAPGMSVRTAWTASVGSGSGLGFAPTVLGESIYAATPDGSVGKFDLLSGRAIWKSSADAKLSAGAGSDGQTTAVATPDGEVIAFDDTGKIKWRARATSDVAIPPVVGYGVVVVRSGDYRIQAFNAENGERMWACSGRVRRWRCAAPRRWCWPKAWSSAACRAASCWPSTAPPATSNGRHGGHAARRQ